MKTINLIALLSLSAFCAMADDSALMTQEHTRAQSAYQMQVKEANMGTDAQIKNQIQNRMQTQMQSQMQMQSQSHMQNRMQQSRSGGGHH